MKKSFAILLVLTTTLSLSYGQQSLSVKGQVLEGEHNYKLIGANVYFNNVDDGTITDINGKFRLESDQPFPWTLTISYIGYHDKKIQLQDANDFQKIYLEEDPSSINKVITCFGPVTTDLSTSKTLRIKITDKATGKALKDVHVFQKKHKPLGTSNSDGIFTINTDTLLADPIVFSAPGYYYQKISLNELTNSLSIKLIPRQELMTCIFYETPPVRQQ